MSGTRYDRHWHTGDMVPAEEGPWVKHDEYASEVERLRDEVSRAEAENLAIRGELEIYREAVEHYRASQRVLARVDYRDVLGLLAFVSQEQFYRPSLVEPGDRLLARRIRDAMGPIPIGDGELRPEEVA